MNYTIAQIGANRLEKVLESNKGQDYKKVLPYLKLDIVEIFKSYAEISDDAVVEVIETANGFCIVTKININRFKNFGMNVL